MKSGYRDLVNAIVVQAVKDWKKVKWRDECEAFFRSSYFSSLVNLDGEAVIQYCEKRTKGNSHESESNS